MSPKRLYGKTVKVRRGPAAVTGDEHRNKATVDEKREGAMLWLIRKPEDRPDRTLRETIEAMVRASRK